VRYTNSLALVEPFRFDLGTPDKFLTEKVTATLLQLVPKGFKHLPTLAMAVEKRHKNVHN
jgi:hypothetical protein